MDIATSLYNGNLIRLTRIEFDKDPAEMARWTRDASYQHLFGEVPARPISPFELNKKLEGIEKSADEGGKMFYFHVRPLGDEHLVGFAKIDWILWASQTARIQFGIGDPAERGKGYGSDVLRLLLRFAFDELNLHRVFAVIPEYNAPASHLLQKFGFVTEVRRREVLALDARRWDMLEFGLLRPEWNANIK
jgi:RimJ/RimL family protein N-acetyltransferase